VAIDVEAIVTIITSVLAILAAILGAKYKVGKDTVTGKATLIAKLLNDVVEAAEDNAVDEAEFQKIVEDVKACIAKPENKI
jgi:hypothetical protein